MSDSIEKVSQVWKEHWVRSDSRPDLSWRGKILRRYIATWDGFASNRFVLKLFLRHAGEVSGKRILDAGAGTGLNSLPLAKRGAKVTLLDVAPQALEIAKAYYSEQGLDADYILGSIFKMPFPDSTFDVVWNTGVIEHFEGRDQAAAVKEMLRVLKSDGVFITINPCSRAKIYRLAKSWAEKRGTWDVGVEYPISTIAPLIGRRLESADYELREEERGWFIQFHFLKYLLPKPCRILFLGVHELLQNLLNFLNFLPGYLLVSTIKRRQPPSSPT